MEAAITGSSAQQTVAETLPETTAVPVEPQVLSGTPAEIAAAATETVVEPGASASASEAVTSGAVASVTATPGKPCAMQGKGRMRKAMGYIGKGMGHSGKGQGCRKQGCDRQGKGQNNKHEQVVRRLDMIDARMAKIEAMLESLMQR